MLSKVTILSLPCGVLLGAIMQVTRFSGTHPQSLIVMVGEILIFKELDTIAQFTAFEDFISFERKGKNKIKRIENNKIKVMIEVDMVCEIIIL